ncbi:tyrosine-type recombinase/integrase [Thaumasiovibrio sp. DFM-14]|uniref:tyrosine-type recombinase/integrase n=1 Tax=Thaumasiovibrio sp. DFM-14 TaxID=3384792 RepID=UPI0039A06A4C
MKRIKSPFLSPIDDIEQWQQLSHQQYSHNSLLSLRNDWHRFLAFCYSIHTPALPAQPTTVVRYLNEMSKSRKYSTLRRYLISINTVHKLAHQPEPSRFREVQRFLKSQQVIKQHDHIQADALHRSHLDKLYLQLHLSEERKDKRDLAIWHLMFETLMKRSELISLNYHHFSPTTNVVVLEDSEYTLSPRTSELIHQWLNDADISHGPLFRGLDRHGNISDRNMDPSAIYRVFRRASELLGLPKHITFSGQSPRVGASKALANDGLTLTEIQVAGRWKSPAMPAQYLGKTEKSEQEKQRFKKQKQWLK